MAYFTILTTVGKAKLANATALGTAVNLTQIAVGDGNGAAVTPTEGMTTLTNQVWIGNLTDLRVDATQSNWIVAEGYIASDVGGFTVREVGLFDDAGDLIAVGNYPDTYKPVFTSGAAKDLLLRIVIEVSNASTVELTIDPAVILATREFVQGYARKLFTYVDKAFADTGYKVLVNDHVRANTSVGITTLKLPAPAANAECEINTGDFASVNKLVVDGDGETITFRTTTDTTLDVNTDSITLRFVYDFTNTTWRVN